MKSWLKYFEYNRDHRREIPWERGVTVDDATRAPDPFAVAISGRRIGRRRAFAQAGRHDERPRIPGRDGFVHQGLSCLVVMRDHRGILRRAGVSPSKFWWDCGLIFNEVSAGIFSCAPTPAFTRPAAVWE